MPSNAFVNVWCVAIACFHFSASATQVFFPTHFDFLFHKNLLSHRINWCGFISLLNVVAILSTSTMTLFLVIFFSRFT